MKNWTFLIVILGIMILFCAFLTFDKEVTLSSTVAIGESEHWKARISEFSYQALWRGTDSKLNSDSKHRISVLLVYKGDNPEDVGEVVYEFDTGSSKFGGTTSRLSQDGIITQGGGGNSREITRKDAMITATVEWDGNKETFEVMINWFK